MEVTMTDSNQGDGVDARGIFGKFLPKPVQSSVEIYGTVDDHEYFMKYPKKGKCLIFNHKEFNKDTKLNVRNGTDADASRLFCRFTYLGFDAKIYTDLTVREVVDKLKEVGEDDHTDYSCFVCCILSHGDCGILYAKDGKYPTESVFAPFRGDVCPTLRGKPKMFFLQACQGDKLDSGTDVMYTKESVDSSSQYRIPTHADFLIVYSTVPGFYSWRNTTCGSWFIQALCAALEKYAHEKDILQIMTVVNRIVAFDFISCVPTDRTMHLKKQVPLVTSTLTRDVKL